jgi:hypothetical protein
MQRNWVIAAIALWIVIAVATNVAFAAHAAPAIPMDDLADAFA